MLYCTVKRRKEEDEEDKRYSEGSVLAVRVVNENESKCEVSIPKGLSFTLSTATCSRTSVKSGVLSLKIKGEGDWMELCVFSRDPTVSGLGLTWKGPKTILFKATGEDVNIFGSVSQVGSTVTDDEGDAITSTQKSVADCQPKKKQRTSSAGTSNDPIKVNNLMDSSDGNSSNEDIEPIARQHRTSTQQDKNAENEEKLENQREDTDMDSSPTDKNCNKSDGTTDQEENNKMEEKNLKLGVNPLTRAERRKLGRKKALELAKMLAQLNGHEDIADKNDKKKTMTTANQSQSVLLKERRLEGGVLVKDIILGSGAQVKSGHKVSIVYEGRLPEHNNRVFQTSTKNKPFMFRHGTGQVVRGLDCGLKGMRVGGHRDIVIPPEMGYGAKGSGPIPPNSTLVFSVQLVKVGS